MLPVSRLELGQRLSLMCYRGVLLSPLANQTQRSSLHFCLSVVFWQAQRARSMGAIVYCVGVKEFNQTQVGSNGGYWRWCEYAKTEMPFIFFLWLFVFPARHYCRHYGTRVSCVGRLPSPQGNHWLGMTRTYHVYTHTNTHPHTQRRTKLSYVIKLSCDCFFLLPLSLRSSRSPA